MQGEGVHDTLREEEKWCFSEGKMEKVEANDWQKAEPEKQEDAAQLEKDHFSAPECRINQWTHMPNMGAAEAGMCLKVIFKSDSRDASQLSNTAADYLKRTGQCGNLTGGNEGRKNKTPQIQLLPEEHFSHNDGRFYPNVQHISLLV